jgi:hypothetical protein
VGEVVKALKSHWGQENSDPVAAVVFRLAASDRLPAHLLLGTDVLRYAVLIILAAVVMTKAFPSRAELERVVAEGYPEQGVNYLRIHPQPQPMLNEIGFGGYMLYSLGTEYRLFIDGRVVDPVVFSNYLHIMQLEPDALSLLRKYDIRSCFIPPKSALGTLLAASPDWDQVYQDQLSAIFVRKKPSGKTKLGTPP